MDSHGFLLWQMDTQAWSRVFRGHHTGPTVCSGRNILQRNQPISRKVEDPSRHSTVSLGFHHGYTASALWSWKNTHLFAATGQALQSQCCPPGPPSQTSWASRTGLLAVPQASKVFRPQGLCICWTASTSSLVCGPRAAGRLWGNAPGLGGVRGRGRGGHSRRLLQEELGWREEPGRTGTPGAHAGPGPRRYESCPHTRGLLQ